MLFTTGLVLSHECRGRVLLDGCGASTFHREVKCEAASQSARPARPGNGWGRPDSDLLQSPLVNAKMSAVTLVPLCEGGLPGPQAEEGVLLVSQLGRGGWCRRLRARATR